MDLAYRIANRKTYHIDVLNPEKQNHWVFIDLNNLCILHCVLLFIMEKKTLLTQKPEKEGTHHFLVSLNVLDRFKNSEVDPAVKFFLTA